MTAPAFRVMLAVLALSAPAPAADEAKPKPKPQAAEAEALAFVRENHPELADLLATLKTMKPGDYDRAIRELSATSVKLALVREQNPRRYEFALDVWKTRSRVDLLTARLAGVPGSGPELESQVRQAVEGQVDAEIRLQRFDRDVVRDRLKRLDENLKNLESRRDRLVDQRFAGQIRKGNLARRQNVGAAGPTAKARTNSPNPGKRQP